MSNSQDFRIPFAYTEDGTAVRPEDAERGQEYFCPCCQTPLVYRQGEKVRAHFAHRSGGSCASYETILHHVAKHKLAEHLRESVRGEGVRSSFLRKCVVCEKPEVAQRLPLSVSLVGVEERAASGFTPDLTLKDKSGSPLCAIEVLVTSAVSDEKAAALEMPWVEIEAEEIMAVLDRGAAAFAVRRESFKPSACAACASRLTRAYDEANSVLRGWRMDWPSKDYVVSYGQCWKCSTLMPLFDWGCPQIGKGKCRPPEPRPRTIRYEYSRMARGRYWANTCPKCKSIQGDHFIFREIGGAFFPDCDTEDGRRKRLLIDVQRNGLLNLFSDRRTRVDNTLPRPLAPKLKKVRPRATGVLKT